MKKVLGRKQAFIISAAALLALAAVTAAVIFCHSGSGITADAPENAIAQGDNTACADGNWDLTKEWTVERSDSGDETLTVLAAEDSTAWNTFFNLYEDWTASADITLVNEHGASDCARLAFGDAYGNIGMVVSAEYLGKDSVKLRADALSLSGWKNVLESDRVQIADGAVNLKVTRSKGGDTYDVVLSQNGESILEAATGTIPETVLNMVSRPGLSAYGSEIAFSGFAVVAAKKQTVSTGEDDGVIEAGENVPTDEWFLGENAVHNLVGGKSAIIIDGEKENYAWNLKNTLGDEWTLSFKVEFGKSYRDSVCSRFMFGPEAEENGEYDGLVTVNYANSQVMLQAEDKEGGTWISTASSMGWKNISGRSVNVKISKYAGINRLAIFLYQGDKLLYSVFTDEIPAEQMAKYTHYGLMAYSSQVRFSSINYSAGADQSIIPSMTEKVYPSVGELAIGEGEKTSAWSLGKHSTYFHENGSESLVIESKGEEYSYYVKNTLGEKWSMSAKVGFGTYYSDTAGVRVRFINTDQDIAALMTVKYSPSDAGIDVQFQTYDKENDEWTDVIRSGWAKGESAFVIGLSGDSAGNIAVKLTGASDGAPLYEKSISVGSEVAAKMQVVGLGALSSQSKFSEISMNMSGKAATLSGGDSEKTMCALRTGTAAETDEWTAGDGIIYDTAGALTIKSSGDTYSYNKVTEIYDAFTISADVLFGSLDSSGVCTARIALVDKYDGMQSLFTIKFSENFEVMAEGQYNLNGKWVSCISDNSWRAVQDNRVHITLSRESGSDTCVLSIRDYGGSKVFSGSCRIPTASAKKVSGFGLGVDNAKVKFTNVSAALGGVKTEPTIEDFGMLPLDTGTAGTTDQWTLDDGVTYNTDGALIITSASNLYSYNKTTKIYDGFSISADIQFGSLDTDGVCGSRIVLVDSAQNLTALFTIKFSENFEIVAEGQYKSGSGWASCVSDNSWRSVKDNRLHATLSRADGSNACVLTISDYDNSVVFSEECEIPEATSKSIRGFGLGVDKATVKFSNMTASATPGSDTPSGAISDITETGELVTASSSWTSGDGIRCYSDGSLILSSGSEIYAYRKDSQLNGAFTVSAKVQFGKPDGQGVSTARIALVNKDNGMAGLFTLKFSDSCQVMAEGQYIDSGKWNGILSNSKWYDVKDNTVVVTITHADGGQTYHLEVTGSDGTKILSEDTSAVPESVSSQITGFGLGCRNTEVKYSEIVPVVVTAQSAESAE